MRAARARQAVARRPAAIRRSHVVRGRSSIMGPVGARARIAVKAILAFLSLGAGLAHAQERGSVAKRVLSPEVSPDHKITLRLQAPNAKSVLVTGDFTGKTLEMTKDADAVWSFTTESLKPSSYQYWFIMDGLTMPDPLNTYVRPASGVYK